MRLYSSNEQYKLYQGNMLDMLEVIEPNSVDSIVTDPPYELNFMNKGWDNSGVAFQKTTWERCFKALKPGGYLLAFGGSRTFHRITCAIEDAGFEIRDTIMWLYGCLSEDTEVLTKSGFKQFHKITEDDIIRVYDTKSRVYKWEKPKKWNIYKTEQDTCYRIKSDSTDQLVSRNHRCLIERDGELVFEFAENLNSVERVPVLSYNIPYLQKGNRFILLKDLLWQDERLAKELFSQWIREEKPKEITLWGNKPKLERWCDLSEKERELCQSENKVCPVSERVYSDGEKRWLCDGTQTISSTADRQTFIKNRGCSSYQSQCRGQSVRESNVICNEQRPQTVRKWETYTTTLATVTEEKYKGYLYCPTVSTGCFVARRNGKVFITGNSGFPKSMNIGLAIDKKNGVESKVIGHSTNGTGAQPNKLNNHTRGDTGIGYADGSGREFDIRQAQNKWAGWGTALKPAYEPVIVARKPCEGSTIDNVLKYGVGGINIDECRVEEKSDSGRFPSNVILTYDETDEKEVCGGMPYSESNGGATTMPKMGGGELGVCNYQTVRAERVATNYVAPQDSGSASRYFYCAKASKKDRDEGLNAFATQKTGDLQGGRQEGSAGSIMQNANGGTRVNPYAGTGAPKKNTHPTVKPTELMQYLIRLVTPNGGTVLDPFNGSGSTGKAVMYENVERNKDYKYIGIELTEEYLPIAKARIEYVGNTSVVVYETVDNGETTKKLEIESLF